MPTLKLKALNTRPPDLTSTPRGYDRYELVHDHVFRTSGLTDELDKVYDLMHKEKREQQRKRRRKRSARSRPQTLLFAGIPPRHGEVTFTSDEYPDLAAFRKSRTWATWCRWYCFNPQSTTYVWRTIPVTRVTTEEYRRYKENKEKIPKNKKEYRRRRNSNPKRPPNQSAEFSPSQHMPPRWIAALHAAHDAQAHKLFTDFDECKPDVQILALVLISFGRFDRELGLS